MPKIKELTDKQKVRIFEKEGYSVHKIGNKYEVCETLKKFGEFQDLINSYYAHISQCCLNCKRKIYRQRYEIKKKHLK